MLQKLIDDVRESTGSALRQTSLALAAAVFLFVTVSFLCATAFVFVLERYGLIQACLAGAGVFFIATLLAAMSYAIQKRKDDNRPKEPTPSAMRDCFERPDGSGRRPANRANNRDQAPHSLACHWRCGRPDLWQAGTRRRKKNPASKRPI